MAIAGDLDVTIEQGATFELVVKSVTDDTGAYQDLTGWTFKGQVRDTPQATTVLAEMAFTPNDLTQGSFIAAIDAVTTGSITVNNKGEPRTAWYDIKLTSPDGTTVRRLLRGNALITPAVTRS
jgi:hypothetical protein